MTFHSLPHKIKTPLQRKLLWTILPVVLLPLALAGIITSVITYRRSLAQIQESLITQTRLTADLAQKDAENRLNLLKFTVQNPLVVDALKVSTVQAKAQGLEELTIPELERRFHATKIFNSQPILNNYLYQTAQQGGFAEVFITERNGFNIAYTRPTSDFVQRDERWWQEGRHLQQWIGDPNFDESTQTITIEFVLSIQDPDTNQFLGVIKGGYDTTYLEDLILTLEQDIQLIESEHLQIIAMGNRPTVIATIAVDGNPTNQQETHNILGGDAVVKEVQRFLNEVPESSKITQTDASHLRSQLFIIEDRLYTAAKIDGTEWAVLTSVNLATVRTIGHNLSRIFLGMSLGLGVISAGVTVLLSRSITHPIQQLTASAQRSVSEANFSLYAPIRTQDEVGVLAKTFNDLIHYVDSLLEDQKATNQQLSTYSQTLAQQVEERTWELREKNEELVSLLRALKDTQSQMLHSEKMSALGQMVAGVAHEINNPVSFIHGNLSYVADHTHDLVNLVHSYQRHYPNPSLALQDEIANFDSDFIVRDLDSILGSMATGTKRIKDIVESLQNFSRLNEAEFKDVDIHEGIDNTLILLQYRLNASPSRPSIQVRKHYGSLPHIQCYPRQLNQVFMSLLMNAIEAIETIWQLHQSQEKYETITSPKICKGTTITITTEQMGGNMVQVAIADDGPGIPEAIQDSIFNPFFTTKPVGKGTGLGLSIGYQIITEQHHGTLQFQSTPQGTTFTIGLPIYQVGAEVSSPSA
ncbi:MAG: ATP-binding protein [Cyanobacteria bacterium P01_F01_bin.150]